MFDISTLPRFDIVCIDAKSFYASTECVLRGLDPLKAKLCVVSDVDRNGSVCLAASPKMKELYGIKTGSRLFEIREIQKRDKQIVVVSARMKVYLEMAKRIRKIFEEFVPPNQVFTYSVDESFLNYQGCLSYWKTDAEGLTRKIMEKVKKETGIVVAAGIGDNVFFSKVALDCYAKKTKDAIAQIRYEDIESKLHPLELHEIWGIGKKLATRFHKLSIFYMGDLAKANPSLINQVFGKNGIVLWRRANGIDDIPVNFEGQNALKRAFGFSFGEEEEQTNDSKSVGRGITLLKDYQDRKEVKKVIREIVEEICEILRRKKVVSRTVHLGIQYSFKENVDGFSRQVSWKNHWTNKVSDVYEKCVELFDKHDNGGTAIRIINVSVSNLKEEEIDELTMNESEIKSRKLNDTLDILNKKYGKGTLVKAFQVREGAVTKERSKKIGGHWSDSDSKEKKEH